MEEYLQIEVARLYPSLYCPTCCLRSVPRAFKMKICVNLFLKNVLYTDRGQYYNNLPPVLFLITLSFPPPKKLEDNSDNSEIL